MSDPRTYWVGLPVGITVHDDGTYELEVDMSEAPRAIHDERFEGEPLDGGDPEPEWRVLLDGALIDSNPTTATLKVGPRGLMILCPARFDCRFETVSPAAMEAHLRDESETHGQTA